MLNAVYRKIKNVGLLIYQSDIYLYFSVKYLF